MSRLHYEWLQRAWVLDARDARRVVPGADAVAALQPGDVAMVVTEHVDA